MLRLLVDSDVDNRLVVGLRMRAPMMDLVVTREVGIEDWPDDRLLDWASVEDRVVLTQDRNTMTSAIKNRIASGWPTTGNIVVSRTATIRRSIEEVEIVAALGDPAAWENRTIYIPLR